MQMKLDAFITWTLSELSSSRNFLTMELAES